jgi:ketosteroid isomerase-like protein
MKQLLPIFAICAIWSSLLISCSNTAGESETSTASSKETKSSFDLDAVRKIIDSTNTVFFDRVAKGDSTGLSSMYTSDGKLMPPNYPAATGSAQIQSTFGRMLATMGPIQVKPTIIGIWGTEEMVVEEGIFVMTKEGKEIDKGKYIGLWKMEDGKWKLFRDMFSSDNPPLP